MPYGTPDEERQCLRTAIKPILEQAIAQHWLSILEQAIGQYCLSILYRTTELHVLAVSARYDYYLYLRAW